MPDKDYIWTFTDVRNLDNRLSAIEFIQKNTAQDIKAIKEELAIKNHIVVDNTSKMDWKTVIAILTAVLGTVGTLALAIWGAAK